MDYIGILTQAAKTLWKHKVIYVFFLVMYATPSLLALGLMGVFVLKIDMSNPENLFGMYVNLMNLKNPLLWGLAGVYLLIMLLTYSCYIIGSIGVMKGTSLVESDAESLGFAGLLQASLEYFWPVAAIFFVIGVTFIVIMIPALVLGSFVILMFLFLIPIFFFGRTFVELLMAAIVNGNLGLQAALESVWQIVQKHLWPLALITILLLVIEFVANTVVSIPIGVVQQVAMFALFPMLTAQNSSLMFGEMFKWVFVLMIFVIPILLAVQGFVMSHHLAATSLFYMNMTRKTVQPTLPVEVVSVAS